MKKIISKYKRIVFLLLSLSVVNISMVHGTPKLSDSEIFELMRSRIQAEFENNANVTQMAGRIPAHMGKYNATNGSFTDIDYSKTDRTDWPPLVHIERLYDMTYAYTMSGNAYYEDETTYNTIVKGLQYWYTRNPNCSNWWYNQIGEPQRIGRMLLQLRKGKKQIPKELETNTLNRMKAEGGNPASQAGPNKTDIALHWLYRACLTEDQTLMENTMKQAFDPLKIVTGEGIQHDNSYFQHGKQLYIGGYGDELIKGTLMFADYALGTQFALDGEKLNIFSKFVRETYFKVIRGKYIHMNSLGRGMSRVNATRKSANFAERLVKVDPTHSEEYKNIIKRIKEEVPASTGIKATNTTYYISDYVIHTRPEYEFSVRTVSARTLRNEYGNGENLKTYFLSDGTTHITQKGDEYFNIFPVWDWNRLPGVTNPQLADIPLAASDMSTPGTETLVGGASDSMYSVNTYRLNDRYKGINTKAQKSWFFFDDEVVCLGAGITSTNSAPINTTLDQNLLKGTITALTETGETTITQGEQSYNGNLKWVLHNNMGYVFPNGGKVSVKNALQKGEWYKINTTEAKGEVTEGVFSLWFDHGTKPENADYAYIVVPNKKSVQEMKSYDAGKIEILANTDSVQVVRHTGLNIIQMVFSRAATFQHKDFTVKTNGGAAIILKNLGKPEVTMHIADPNQEKSAIIVGTLIPSISEEMKQTVADFYGTEINAGKTKVYKINKNSEKYVPEIDTEPELVIEKESVALADLFVQNGGANENKNFGGNATIIIKKDGVGFHREGFLKFSLEDLDEIEDLEKYDLKLFVSLYLTNTNTGASGIYWELYPVQDTTWKEMEVTFKTKPKVVDPPVTRAKGFIMDDENKNALFDITQYALDLYKKGHKQLSFNVMSSSGNGKHDAQFASKENAKASDHPKLKIQAFRKNNEFVEPETPKYIIENVVIEDAYVESKTKAAINYGFSENIKVKNTYANANDAQTFLKFNLKNIETAKKDSIGSVFLRLYLTDTEDEIRDVLWTLHKVSDNSWKEGAINYNNKPTKEEVVSRIYGELKRADEPYTYNKENIFKFDITDYVLEGLERGDEEISLALYNNTRSKKAKNGSSFGSKENPIAEKQPVLQFYVYERLGEIPMDELSTIESLQINGKPWRADYTYLIPQNYTEKTVTVDIKVSKGATLKNVEKQFEVNVEKPSLQSIEFAVDEDIYHVIIEKRFDFKDLVTIRWNNTLTVNNLQGYQFSKYQWFCNGKAILGATQQSYSVGQNGEKINPKDKYSVKVVDTTGTLNCWESETELVKLKTVVYPNPANVTETVTVDADISDELIQGAVLNVYDISGNVLKTVSVKERKTLIQMPNRSGLYLIKLICKDGYTKDLKIIVK